MPVPLTVGDAASPSDLVTHGTWVMTTTTGRSTWDRNTLNAIAARVPH